MALLYPFLVIDKGIKTNVLGKDIFFRFIIPPVLKEKHCSKNVTILTDINERGIYRADISLSSLKTQILVVDQMTENDKKKDRETEICYYSPIFFLHKYQHKVQYPRAKELSRKGIKDGNMDAIFCSQYAWIDSMIEVPNKIIVNDIFTISLNIHMKDILIKEALTDSPLLIIKENVNCGNFLNNGIFTLLTDKINYNPLTDFPINKRLYKEILFYIPSQNEIYSKIYMDRIILDFKNLLNLTYFDRIHHDYSNTATTQQEHKDVQRKVCFIINAFLAFLKKHFEKISQKHIDRKTFKITFTKALQAKIYFKIIFQDIIFFPKPNYRLL